MWIVSWRDALPKTQPSCPAVTCKGKDPEQDPIAATVLENAGATGGWIANARRCSHCGCVYAVHGRERTIKGYFDNPVMPPGWRPIFG